jgi:hypothetical protein
MQQYQIDISDSDHFTVLCNTHAFWPGNARPGSIFKMPGEHARTSWFAIEHFETRRSSVAHDACATAMPMRCIQGKNPQ